MDGFHTDAVGLADCLSWRCVKTLRKLFGHKGGIGNGGVMAISMPSACCTSDVVICIKAGLCLILSSPSFGWPVDSCSFVFDSARASGLLPRPLCNISKAV
jgi:polysaccharide pyruvyl transferase WcaK-like protein